MSSAAYNQEEIHMQLFEAVEKGDLNTLKTLLEPPLSVDVILKDVYVLDGRCTRKPTLLIIAAAFSQLHILQFLLSKGANPNICDKRQRYPLHFAAMKGDIDIMRALLQAKAEVNKQDWDNCAPLHFCASNGFISGAKALLDEGAAINIQTRMKETPLIVAIEYKQIEMIRFLISSRADVQKPALQHRTPLFFVSDGESTQLLIKAGAQVNYKDDQDYTPLHRASSEGYVEVARVLIENGADVNSTDKQKQTPLHVSASNGQVEMCRLLLQNGAEVKALDIARRSPEMLARRNDHFDVTSVISSFTEAAEDDDAPPIGFKAFTGIKHLSSPPPGMQSEIKPEDLKFNFGDD